MSTEVISMLGDLSNIIMAIGAIVASILAFKAYKKSKQLFRHQIISDFFMEYRSPEMGQSIKELWDFWRKCGGKENVFGDEKVKINVINTYERQYKLKGSNKVDSLHNHRRRVSLFFQHMSVLAKRDKEIKELMSEVWLKQDMVIIPELLEPIEMVALKKAIDGEVILDSTKYPNYMKNLLLFYNESSE